MNKFTYFLFLIILSLPLYAQKSNCEFSVKAQNHIRKGTELVESVESRIEQYSTSYDIEILLNAATELEQALKYNPKCEDILLILAEIYFRVGKIGMKDMDYAWNSKDSKKVKQSVNSYFSKAKLNIEKSFKSGYDPSIRIEGNQLLENIYFNEYEFNIAADGKIKSLKDAEETAKNTQGFFSLGVGYGEVFGQPGQLSAKASLFSMSAKGGVGIIGGIGYPLDYFLYNDQSLPLLWFAGGGFSFGSYKWNFQFLGLYGKIQTRENFFENTGGLTLATNIKLFSDIALNMDAGYWLSDTSDIAAVFSFSVGLCCRFRFN